MRKVAVLGAAVVAAVAACFGIALALAPHPTLASTAWYVAPAGNDASDCQSPATPCATINGVLGKAGFVAGDTVRVAVGVYTGVLTEVIMLDRSVTLSGGWNDAFTTQVGTSVIDGQRTRRGITVLAGVTATLDYFTVQYGNGGDLAGGIYNGGGLALSNGAVVSNGGNNGGGIYNSGSLDLFDTRVMTNTGVGRGGGIYNAGTLNVNASIVESNTNTYTGGGGIYNGPGAILTLRGSSISRNSSGFGGGAIVNHGTMTLTTSRLADNRSSLGGAILNDSLGADSQGSASLSWVILERNSAMDGGAIDNYRELTITQCIISGNTASGGGGIMTSGRLTMSYCSLMNNRAGSSGGGISSGGETMVDSTIVVSNTADTYRAGGIENAGKLMLTRSTVASNAAPYGAGIANFSILTLTNSTVSGNTASQGGGGMQTFATAFYSLSSALINSTVVNNRAPTNTTTSGIWLQAGPLSMTNSIIANNGVSADDNFSITQGTLTSGGHNLSNGNIPFAAPSDIENRDPLLSLLQNNGGPTLTHLPLPSSPAINNGDNSICPATDQRGVTRPQGGVCDIGSVEVGPLWYLPLIGK